MIRYRHNLPKLVHDLGLPMIGAELGCAEGYFSNDLLEGGLTLYMVDAWATLNQTGDGASPQEWHDKNFSNAMARVRKHGEKAIVLRGLTTDMAELVPDGSLGLLYLDAGHDYKSVLTDLNTWFPKVCEGGVIAGHDYLNRAYGVFDAVRDFTNEKYEIHTLIENKPEDAGFLFIK